MRKKEAPKKERLFPCPTCGKEFELKKNELYLLKITDNKWKQCFDCPHCGCQVRAGERFGMPGAPGNIGEPMSGNDKNDYFFR